jgi:capsular polysaccharide biosynthesis protein
VNPRIAAGAVAASVLIAVVVVCWSLLQTPKYEAPALVLVDERSPAQETGNGRIRLIPLAPTPEERQALTQTTQTMIIAINTRPVAEEAIRRLGLDMSPDELLSNLTVEQVETSQFIRLSYTDTDPVRATQVVNTVGQVSSERISVKSEANDMTATLYDKASVPSAPANPKSWRNGLFALAVGLALAPLAGYLAGEGIERSYRPGLLP